MTDSDTRDPLSAGRLARLAPWTGVAFVVCFVGSVVASSPPGETASNATWVANYATHTKQIQHLATGLLLVAAAMCLITFMTHIWGLVAAARRPHATGPLPIVAAAVASACVAIGGVLMASESGMLLSSAPMPNPDLLRFTNDIGFTMVAIPGMIATAIGVAGLTLQAHHAGLFGRWLLRFGLAVSVVLLASFAFLPIVALLGWLLVTSVVLLRGRVATPMLESAITEG